VVRFAVIGDSGTGERPQYQIARQMAAWHERMPFDLVLMLGDNIYGGWLGFSGGNRKYFNEQFDQPYADLLRRRVIFRAALGNHDLGTRNGQDLIDAHGRFHIDGPLGYYRFTAGEWHPHAAGAPHAGGGERPAPLVEFFVLNTNRMIEGKQDPEQLAWLEKALASSRAQWRIVYGHHPIYSSGHRHGGDEGLRAMLEPILTKPTDASESSPRVQIYLAGHDHIYQRLRPQKCVVHFVCGAGGQLRKGNARPSPQVAAGEDQQRVFMLWEATRDELRFRAINETGDAFDCGVVREGSRVENIACTSLAKSPPSQSE